MGPRPGILRSGILTLTGAVSCALAAAVCLGMAWWVVFQTRIGPVMLELTAAHGVHAGDAVGGLYAAFGLLLVVRCASLSGDAARKLRLAIVPAARRRAI